MRSRTVLSCFFLFFIGASLISGQAIKNSNGGDDAKAQVERVLRTQQDAWNRHDLEAFMAGCASRCWERIRLLCAGRGC